MRQIESIQRLRALAALMVVIGHAQTEAIVAALKHGYAFTPLSLLPWGAGVDLFFVISGFIMVVASERLFGRADGGVTFAARRLKRIVPLYWMFTTLYVLIQFATRKPVGGFDLIASYLFWPRDIFGDGFARPIFALGWTLEYEVFFYALFALAIVLPARRAVAAVTVVLAAAVGLGAAWRLPAGPLAFWSQPIVLEFAAGMGLALAWRAGVRLPAAARLAVGFGGALVLMYDPLGSAHRPSDWITPNDFGRVLSWGMPAAALVAAAALGHRRAPGQPARFGLVALGDASYALYLVHPFVIGTAMRAWTAAGLGSRVGDWPLVAASLVVSIVAAFAVHAWFERPVARLLALRRLDGKPILPASQAAVQ